MKVTFKQKLDFIIQEVQIFIVIVRSPILPLAAAT